MVEFQFKWQSGKERLREIECLHGVGFWLPLWFNLRKFAQFRKRKEKEYLLISCFIFQKRKLQDVQVRRYKDNTRKVYPSLS
jgi:hypothetical protein